MSLLLVKRGAVLNSEYATGHRREQIGIAFTFVDGIDVLITDQMYERIRITFEHHQQLESKK